MSRLALVSVVGCAFLQAACWIVPPPQQAQQAQAEASPDFATEAGQRRRAEEQEAELRRLDAQWTENQRRAAAAQAEAQQREIEEVEARGIAQSLAELEQRVQALLARGEYGIAEREVGAWMGNPRARERAQVLLAQIRQRADGDRLAESAFRVLDATVRDRIAALDWDAALAAIESWQQSYADTEHAPEVEATRLIVAALRSTGAERPEQTLRWFVAVERVLPRATPGEEARPRRGAQALIARDPVEVRFRTADGWLLVSGRNPGTSEPPLARLLGWVRRDELVDGGELARADARRNAEAQGRFREASRRLRTGARDPANGDRGRYSVEACDMARGLWRLLVGAHAVRPEIIGSGSGYSLGATIVLPRAQAAWRRAIRAQVRGARTPVPAAVATHLFCVDTRASQVTVSFDTSGDGVVDYEVLDNGQRAPMMTFIDR